MRKTFVCSVCGGPAYYLSNPRKGYAPKCEGCKRKIENAKLCAESRQRTLAKSDLQALQMRAKNQQRYCNRMNSIDRWQRRITLVQKVVRWKRYYPPVREVVPSE